LAHRLGGDGEIAQRKLFVPQVKVDRRRRAWHLVLLVVRCLFLLIFWQRCFANPKTSTIAAPNIEIMMNN
jgi:hypothetical protein